MEFDANDNGFKSVYLSIKISPKDNRLLTEASQNSARSKSKEALLRLSDHLNKYESISGVKRAEPRK